jgi:hypothetical protein
MSDANEREIIKLLHEILRRLKMVEEEVQALVAGR